MIRLLLPQIQRFAWGSPTAIPEILGIEVNGEPLAEAWFGATSQVAPGPVIDLTDRPKDGEWPLLGELVSDSPRIVLGDDSERGVDGHLRFPFLVKFLAAAWPLSIQVHPSVDHARAGFARENSAGIPLDSPERIYKDPNAKPEAIVALEPFQLLAGFRDPVGSAELIDELGIASLASVAEVLRRGGAAGVEAALRHLCQLEEDAAAKTVSEVVAACDQASRENTTHAEQCGWVARLGRDFPADVGVVFALLMNHLHLDPFDLAFVPEGMVHSYLVGSGLEVMGNSDNVVRGGLTIKPTHLDELLQVVDFEPGLPKVVRADGGAAGSYDIPSDAFALDVIDIRGDSATHHASEGPEIIVTLDGAVDAHHDSEEAALPLSRGAAAFVAAGTGRYRLAGEGRIARITLPRITLPR